MEDTSSRVEFRLFCFGNTDASLLLSPEGTIVFQYLGFPYDFQDCTCIPFGPVGAWSRTGLTELDPQWYKRTQKITRKDIPLDLTGSPRVKDHLCHQLRPDPDSYPLSALYVDGMEVQMVAFFAKKICFRRLGHFVEIDLKQVPDNQRFTLTVEWSFFHLEARVTWLEGEGLDQHFSGQGIPYEEFAEYQPPQVGKVTQFKDSTQFETTLISAVISKAIWDHSKDSISDTDESGEPNQQFLDPRKAYRDRNDYLQTMLNLFSGIQRCIDKTKPHAFWNNTQPKSEPDSGCSLRIVLESICAYKGIRVYQEDPSRSGSVDFVFSGFSMEMEHLEIILEIKNAHSTRLGRGITHQLPK